MKVHRTIGSDSLLDNCENVKLCIISKQLNFLSDLIKEIK